MISTDSLHKKFGMLSVNQLNAQIKLLEVWKALNVVDYPLKVAQQKVPELGMSTWAAEKGKPIEIGKSNLTRNSSISDAIRVWNLSPENITLSRTIYQVKNAIKNYVRSLPVLLRYALTNLVSFTNQSCFICTDI